LKQELLKRNHQSVELIEIARIPYTIYDSDIYGGRVAYLKTPTMHGKTTIVPSGKLISVGTITREQAKHDLQEPIDPMTALQQSETFHLDDITIAMIESEAKSHKFPLKLDMKKRRQVPPNPQITVNVNLNLPPNISPQQIPENIQGILQQALNQLAQDVQRQTQQELIRQSPEVGVDIRNYGGRWIENREN
jgi:hypothetical protein